MLSRIPRRYKNRLRGLYSTWKRSWASLLHSYGSEDLGAALRSLGVRRGDSVMLHSAFSRYSGFTGTVGDAIDVFQEAVGPEGNLLMVSLPYMSSSRKYLERLTRFDVRKTPSSMGLVSEFFRRRPGVLRSLHPTHPMLAIGPRAEWIVAGHESSIYPCGPETPFGKLAQLHGKALFFDAPFAAFTFFHYLEHRVHERLPFPLYHDHVFRVPVIDRDGVERTVETYAFSDEVIRRRRFPILETELTRRGLIARKRVGNSVLLAVGLESVIDCVDDMIRRNMYFYDMS